jgi:DNA mismatch repair protein MutS
MFANEEQSPLVDALQGIEPDHLTPRQALELLYRLKEMADEHAL